MNTVKSIGVPMEGWDYNMRIITIKELREMCENYPTEFNRGYILALMHNNLINKELYNDLDILITENNEYKEESAYNDIY